MYKYSKEAKETLFKDQTFAFFFAYYSFLPELHTKVECEEANLIQHIMGEFQLFSLRILLEPGAEEFKKRIECKFGENANDLFVSIKKELDDQK